MPVPLLRLQLALGAPTADVGAIGEAIRSDIGLAGRFLRMAARDLGGFGDDFPCFEELVIHLGLDQIRQLASQAVTLTDHPGGLMALLACERSWKRARLTGLTTEYLAARTEAVDPDKAYLAGLFYHLGYCLRSLNRDEHEAQLADPHELGYSLACAWDFPSVILGSIRRNKHEVEESTSQLLREIVKTALEWVLDVELQGIADAEYSQSLQCVEMFAKGRRKN